MRFTSSSTRSRWIPRSVTTPCCKHGGTARADRSEATRHDLERQQGEVHDECRGNEWNLERRCHRHVRHAVRGGKEILVVTGAGALVVLVGPLARLSAALARSRA